ncbi:hypothetical protein OSK26_21025, partial [Escherichia coli]|nr:hypothetical protein [Escherichia coli]
PLLIWWTPLCLIRQILTRRFRLYAYEHNARLLVGPAVALIHYLNEMCQSTETAVNDTFCRTLTRESLAIP